MTHLAFLRWPKTSPTDAAAAVPAATCSMSAAKDAATNSSSSCGLAKLIRKLKRRSKIMMLCTPGSRQPPAFQCRYDPLSYSLNFDAGGGRSLADEDDDYYFKFCAFSSRFAAIPTN